MLGPEGLSDDRLMAALLSNIKNRAEQLEKLPYEYIHRIGDDIIDQLDTMLENAVEGIGWKMACDNGHDPQDDLVGTDYVAGYLEREGK